MRTLLVINAALDPAQERQIAAGAYPRKDYLELRDALGTDILDLAALDARRWTRLARRFGGSVLAQALLAWTLSPRYEAVFADQETTGFALAALYKLPFFRRSYLRGHEGAGPTGRRAARVQAFAGWMPAVPVGTTGPGGLPALPVDSPSPASGRGALDRRPQPRGQLATGQGGEGRPRLTMIGHFLSPRGKQLLVRGLRLGETIDAVVVHSSLQQRLAERTLGLRADQVALVPYQTDERFWAPRDDTPVKNQICSAGLEYRDYETLIDAVVDVPVEVTIAAASQWSTFTFAGDERALPANVTVASFDYAGLRELYAASLFVVVPLRDVENQAGITTILEAMAMGKAVIVSHTRGQTDVVRDRRHRSRVMPDRPSQPDWTLRLGATSETAQGHTGIYAPPGDPAELRKAIVYLLEHPEEARAMGVTGRRVVEETMSLDLFTRRMASVIMGR